MSGGTSGPRTACLGDVWSWGTSGPGGQLVLQATVLHESEPGLPLILIAYT